MKNKSQDSREGVNSCKVVAKQNWFWDYIEKRKGMRFKERN